MAGSCDNRCTSGKEGTCQCSCGGANHGTATQVWDVLQDGGTATIRGSGLNLDLSIGGKDGNYKGVEVMNQSGTVVQKYRSKEEFVKDLGKFIQAGRVEVTATDAYNHRKVNLPADPERSNRNPKLTQKEALAQIRATGATVNVKDGEFRVNVPGGGEGPAYYTDDPKDAIGTAKAMMEQHRKLLEKSGTPQSPRLAAKESHSKVAEMAHQARRDAANLSDKNLNEAYEIVKNSTTDVAQAYKEEHAARALGRELAAEGVTNSDAQGVIEARFRDPFLQERALETYQQSPR